MLQGFTSQLATTPCAQAPPDARACFEYAYAL